MFTCDLCTSWHGTQMIILLFRLHIPHVPWAHSMDIQGLKKKNQGSLSVCRVAREKVNTEQVHKSQVNILWIQGLILLYVTKTTILLISMGKLHNFKGKNLRTYSVCISKYWFTYYCTKEQLNGFTANHDILSGYCDFSPVLALFFVGTLLYFLVDISTINQLLVKINFSLWHYR